MSNSIVIRVDGSKEIGVGHIMRCISLAEELSQTGLEPIFCIKPLDKELPNEMLDRSFEVSKIPIDATLEEDAKCLTMLASKCKSKAIVVDGYHFDRGYLKQIRKITALLLSIDDIAETFFCCDMVLNQNINATKKMYYGKTSEDTKLLLGPIYALLRPEFKKLHHVERNFDNINNVLVTLGGADPDNQTMKVLKALEKLRVVLNVTVVLGVSNPNKESIRRYVASINRSIEILENAKNMGELMLNADIAISAGGSTSWELSCLGLPTIQIVQAKNQEGVAEELDRREVTVNLGWFERVTENDIATTVESLINNVDKLKLMSSKGRALVDGKGAERVASEICTYIGM